MTNNFEKEQKIRPDDFESAAGVGQVKLQSCLRWFGGSIGGFISLAIGILGLAFGVVSYFAAISKPELSYCQQPVQTVMVRAGELSRLSVTYNGKPVMSDITATQIAIWNAGTKAIRSDDVLEPITLKIDAMTPILEAKVRYVTREVITFRVGQVESEVSELPVNFLILEPGDGAIVQLIYAGKPGVQIAMSGVLIGQKSIYKAKLLSTKKNEKYTPSSTVKRIAQLSGTLALGVFVLVILAALTLSASYYNLVKLKSSTTRKGIRRLTGSALLAIGVACLVLIVFLLLDAMSYSLGPPFNF